MQTVKRSMKLEELPELSEAVGMAGGLEAEGGGQPCAETGVLLAILVYSVSDQ